MYKKKCYDEIIKQSIKAKIKWFNFRSLLLIRINCSFSILFTFPQKIIFSKLIFIIGYVHTLDVQKNKNEYCNIKVVQIFI